MSRLGAARRMVRRDASGLEVTANGHIVAADEVLRFGRAGRGAARRIVRHRGVARSSRLPTTGVLAATVRPVG